MSTLGNDSDDPSHIGAGGIDAVTPVIRDRAPALAPGPGGDPPSQSVARARFPGVHPWRALSALQVKSNTCDPYARSANGMPGSVFHVPVAVTGLTGTGWTTRVAVGRGNPARNVSRHRAIGIEAPAQTLVRAAIHHVIPAHPSRREQDPGRSKASRTAAIATSGPPPAFIPPGPRFKANASNSRKFPVRSIAHEAFHILR